MMDWTKQAETMMQTWTEAQKKMFEGWVDLAQGSASNSGMPFAFYPDMMKQWQEMATMGLSMWTSGADPAATNAAKQLLAGQEAMSRFMSMITHAWQAIAPKIEAGEDWQTVINEYSEKWVESLVGGPVGMLNASKDINQLWKFYMQEWQQLSQPWLKLWQQSPGNLGQVMLGGGTELAELTKLHWDVYERTFGGLTEIPGMGYNRELNAKIVSGFESWVDFQKVSADYQLVLAKTSAKAFEKFMHEIVEMAEKGESIDNVRDLMNLWMEITDQTFVKMYVSDEYLKVQKELAAAGMRYKMRQQDIMEIFLKMNDLPTRSELDDAYRSLNELRREVRALKKALKSSDKIPAKTTAAKTTKRKTSAKKSPEVAVEAAGNGKKGDK